jgi:hypothetical protein
MVVLSKALLLMMAVLPFCSSLILYPPLLWPTRMDELLVERVPCANNVILEAASIRVSTMHAARQNNSQICQDWGGMAWHISVSHRVGAYVA